MIKVRRTDFCERGKRRNFSLGNRPLKIIVDDQKFFKTTKESMPFIPPKPNYIIHNTRILHDSNYFNKHHMHEDYLDNYMRRSFKIKDIIIKNEDIDYYKDDLSRLKFNGGIRVFNGFRGQKYNVVA